MKREELEEALKSAYLIEKAKADAIVAAMSAVDAVATKGSAVDETLVALANDKDAMLSATSRMAFIVTLQVRLYRGETVAAVASDFEAFP